MPNKIIAVVGMCGSGKSELTDTFIANGWRRVYFGGVTMSELERRGLPVTPENERNVREELRAKHGMAAFAVSLLPEIEAALEQGNVVLDGLYSWSEYKYLSERLPVKVTLLAVVTNRALRYSRLETRNERPLTPEQAAARDYAEIENLEKGGPIADADVYLTNNGTKEEFKEKIAAFM